MKIRAIAQMSSYLSQLPCHEISVDNNIIKAKSLIRSSSFPSFQIRYMKDCVSLKASVGKTIRYNSEEGLLSAMGSMAMTQVLK